LSPNGTEVAGLGVSRPFAGLIVVNALALQPVLCICRQ